MSGTLTPREQAAFDADQQVLHLARAQPMQQQLVLAFDLYEDIDREEEILQLNRARALHPGFLAGTLTVLTV